MLLADLRHALRVFRAYPGVTTVAILSLAVGIGANSVMFSIVDGMYLRPLPVRDPAGLVWIGNRMADGRTGRDGLARLPRHRLIRTGFCGRGRAEPSRRGPR